MARDRWKALLRQHGWPNNSRLAAAAKMTQAQLYLISSGRRGMRLWTARRLAAVIGCSLDELAAAVCDDPAPTPEQIG